MSEIQAVRFNKKLWNPTTTNIWLDAHGFQYILLTESKNFLRYRIYSPNQFNHFITKKQPNGIEFIIGFY